MSGNPWDIKTFTLFLGEDQDEKQTLRIEVFDNKVLNIYEGDTQGEEKWFCEDIGLDEARKIRDFLNYAIKD